jgi:replicative DNA helicase
MNAPYLSVVDRIPPNNLEAEMALLGSVLVDKEMMATVSEIVRAEDFYASLHETIFLALTALNERGEPLDKISLAEELRSRGMLDKVGGIAYLSSLMDTVATAASAEYYAKIVREKSSLRGLIHAGTQITKLGYEAEDDVPAALDSSEQIVYDVTNRGTKKSFAPVGDLLLGVFQDLERRFEHKGDRTGVTSGYRDIDEYTAGWQPGNLVIVAARPAMGKTSIALNMAVAAAKDERLPVAIFSLEMTKQELVERFISSEGKLDASKLRRGSIKETEWEDIGKAMGVLHDLPIYLDDSGSVTVTEIRSRCRRLKSSVGLAAVFIDYLQLVRPGTMGRNVNRNEELSDICRVLKATAKDLMVPIVALAQLNRGVEARQDKRPMLADLRDCLAADSLVTDADTGERCAMGDIVERGLRFNVWAVDEQLRLVRRPIVDAWQVGRKQLHRVTTQSGRVIRCTAGHRFLTVSGWSELKDLVPGRAIAVPRVRPRSPSPKTTMPPARVAATAEFGPRDQGKAMSRAARAMLSGGPFLRSGQDAKRELCRSVLTDEQRGGRPRTDSRLPSYLRRTRDALAVSDVLWDSIVAIEAEGEEAVYDLTVGDLHNFCVNDIVTHNSGAIEQEADLVTFLYRDAYYNRETTPDPDLTEFIIAKHRNGKVGTVRLRFLQEHTLFVPYGDESHFAGP